VNSGTLTPVTLNNNYITKKQTVMNVNSNHPVLAALFERLRKMKKMTIGDLSRDAHITTGTYEKVKKGLM